MVFKKQDNLQKIRYEIIRERIVRNRIINKITFGVIGILTGGAILLFDFNFMAYIVRFAQYITPNWILTAICAFGVWVFLIIGATLLTTGVTVYIKSFKLRAEYKKDYGIDVFMV